MAGWDSTSRCGGPATEEAGVNGSAGGGWRLWGEGIRARCSALPSVVRRGVHSGWRAAGDVLRGRQKPSWGAHSGGRVCHAAGGALPRRWGDSQTPVWGAGSVGGVQVMAAG